MSWSAQFIADLQVYPSDPIFIVHFMKPIAGGAVVPGVDELKLSSSPEYGDITGLGMAVNVSGSSLRPVDWSYTAARASVVYVADSANSLTHVVRRGQVARILMGFAGYSFEDFEPVFMGRVAGISGSGPSWQVDFDDASTLLQQRWTGTANRFLFNTAGQTTTLSGTYTAGDGTINVVDNTKIQITGGSGPVGLVKIEPNSGESFYVKFTGKGSGTLTGGGASGVHGTTAATANTGNTITNVPFLNGSSLNIYKRLLTSDGTATGAPNIYPEEWGFGLPEDYVDVDDIDAQSAVLTTSGTTCSPEWKVLEEQEQPWNWLFGLFKPLGLIPVVRQGMFSMRAIQNPNEAEIDTGITIADDEVVDFVWHAYHPDVQAEYLSVNVTTTDGNNTNTVGAAKTFPVDYVLTYDLTDTTWAHSTSGQSNIRSNVLGRVFSWGIFVPYALQLDCAGLRLAQLCPGDIVTLELESLSASNGYDEYYVGLTEVRGYSGRRAMVTTVSADFVAGLVSLELAIVPDFE